MCPRKIKTPQPPSTIPSFIELLIGDDLKPLFSQGFVSDCLDPMGYDLRLGADMRLVTRGEVQVLNEGGEIEIYPGETIIVRTEEVLNLPDDVFAVGSPKMKLLVEGLWAHGGKTDPGYNLPLNLGFQNVGSKPCQLGRGQKIFHLTFFKIHGKTPRSYAGRGPGFPTLEKPPLENRIEMCEKILEDVKKIEGIKSYRICKQILKLRNRMKRGFTISLAGLFIALFIAVLWYYRMILDPQAIIALSITIIGMTVSQVIVNTLSTWISKRLAKT